MWILSLIEVGLSYLGWGLNTGMTFNPDVETIMIIRLMAILNLICNTTFNFTNKEKASE